MDLNRLRRKTILASAISFAVLGLFLFVPAGTARYWPGWLYLGLFAAFGLWACFRLWRLDPELLSRRIGPGPLSEPNRDQRIIQAINSVTILALYAVCGWDFGAHGPRVATPLILLANVVMLGTLWGFWVVVRVNHYAAATVEVTAGQKVIDRGPYAVVRHPMYASAALMMLVTPPALASLWGLAPAILVVAGMVARLLREERYLREKLPGYVEYCRKVRWRLIPSVW